jgi:succinate dehydrogenase / fumarate reductase flavoprotein subunit
MLVCAEAVTLSALARQESRGGHSRIDFPGTSNEWAKKNNVVARDGERMLLKQAPLAEMPEELQKILAEEEVAKAGK